MWGGTACGIPWGNVMLYQKYLLGFYRNARHFSRAFGIFAEMFYIGAVISNVQILLWFHHGTFYPFKYISKK